MCVQNTGGPGFGPQSGHAAAGIVVAFHMGYYCCRVGTEIGLARVGILFLR